MFPKGNIVIIPVNFLLELSFNIILLTFFHNSVNFLLELSFNKARDIKYGEMKEESREIRM